MKLKKDDTSFIIAVTPIFIFFGVIVIVTYIYVEEIVRFLLH